MTDPLSLDADYGDPASLKMVGTRRTGSVRRRGEPPTVLVEARRTGILIDAGRVPATAKPRLAVYSHIVPSPTTAKDLEGPTRKTYSGPLVVGRGPDDDHRRRDDRGGKGRGEGEVGGLGTEPITLAP